MKVPVQARIRYEGALSSPGASDTHYSILSARHGLADPGEDAASVGGGHGVEQREGPPDDAVGAGYRPGSQERRSSLCRVAGLGG